MIWFTSDPHFGHSNIMKYEPKRQTFGPTIQDCDREIIKRFNSKVKPSDTLYILGDVGLTDQRYLQHCISQINGTKILVMGNHDRNPVNQYLKFGFTVVCYEMKLKIAKEFALLSHYPYRKPWYKALRSFLYGHRQERDRHKRPPNKGSWLLHGHIHSGGGLIGDGGWKLRGKQINVGVDVWDYYPVSMTQIENIITAHKSDTASPALLAKNFVIRIMEAAMFTFRKGLNGF